MSAGINVNVDGHAHADVDVDVTVYVYVYMHVFECASVQVIGCEGVRVRVYVRGIANVNNEQRRGSVCPKDRLQKYDPRERGQAQTTLLVLRWLRRAHIAACLPKARVREATRTLF